MFPLVSDNTFLISETSSESSLTFISNIHVKNLRPLSSSQFQRPFLLDTKICIGQSSQEKQNHIYIYTIYISLSIYIFEEICHKELAHMILSYKICSLQAADPGGPTTQLRSKSRGPRGRGAGGVSYGPKAGRLDSRRAGVTFPV